MNPHDRGSTPPLDDRLIAVLWSAQKGGRSAVCELWKDPIGFEVRVDIDADTRQTAAFRMRENAEDQAVDWLEMFKAKGWDN